MRFASLVLLNFVLITGISFDITAQNFTRVEAGFPIAHNPANILADLDNDGDLDAFVAGMDETDVPQAGVYLNNAGTYSLSSSLEGVYDASCSIGDFNNDGLADLAVCGMNSSGPSTIVYRNDGGGTFTNISAGFTGLYGGGIAWGDYNNDGLADLLISGADASEAPNCLLYINNGDDSFTATGISFTGLAGGDVAWSDVDKDEDLDFAIIGENASGSPETILYINNNGDFSPMGAGITGLKASSASWGDFNDDTYPDLLLTGATAANTTLTAVYKNVSGSSFSTLTTSFKGVAFGSGIWGDFDNDGMLDMVISGQEVEDNGGGGPPMPGEPAELLLYLNQGNEQFTGYSLTAGGVEDNTISCGDYDNDSDLDLLVSGEMINAIGQVTESTAIFRNETVNTNDPPSAPDGLIINASGTDFFMEWNASTDDMTPSNGLNYNIRIGTLGSNMDVFSALADLDIGYRRVAAIGNTGTNTSWNILDLSIGVHYVSVQAIDPSYAGSAFSEDVILEIIPTADFTAEDSVCVFEETTIEYTGNASPAAQYIWSFDGATIVSGSGQGPYTVYWETGELKTVTLTVTENGISSEPFSRGVMVIAYPDPPGFIAGSTQLCQGTLSSDYFVPPIAWAIEYEWALNPPEAGSISGNSTTATVQWDPSFHGHAYVFVRGMNYCGYGPYSDSLEVILAPLPEKPPLPTGPTDLCLGNQNTTYFTTAVAYADGYQWYLFPESAGIIFNNGLQAEVDWSASYSGEAIIIVAGYNTCGQGLVSDSLLIRIEVPPVANAGDDQSILFGSTTQLSGSASGGTGIYTYFWMPDSLLLDPHAAAPTTVPLQQSVQFVLYASDNLTACFGVDQMVVTVTGGPLMVDAVADPEQICPGEEVNLLALTSGGSGNYTFAWTSDPPGFVSNEAEPVVYPEVNTVYHVHVSDSGDEVNDSVQIFVDPLPGPAGSILGAESVCTGDEQILFEVDDVPYANLYLWEMDEGIFGSSDSASILLSFAEDWILGGGNISVTPANSCGLGEASQKYIQVWGIPGKPEMVTGVDTLCTTTDTASNYMLQTPVQGAIDYTWELQPAEAGNIIYEGMIATVYWVRNWEGEAAISIKAINDCGTSEWSDPYSVWAFNCLGISDGADKNLEVSLYPNPAYEVLGVRCYVLGEAVKLDLILYDLYGRRIIESTHPGRGVVEINTSGIPAGMYILSLQGENGLKVSKRVVIQH